MAFPPSPRDATNTVRHKIAFPLQRDDKLSLPQNLQGEKPARFREACAPHTPDLARAVVFQGQRPQNMRRAVRFGAPPFDTSPA
jgi:hypothetical protein